MLTILLTWMRLVCPEKYNIVPVLGQCVQDEEGVNQDILKYFRLIKSETGAKNFRNGYPWSLSLNLLKTFDFLGNPLLVDISNGFQPIRVLALLVRKMSQLLIGSSVYGNDTLIGRILDTFLDIEIKIILVCRLTKALISISTILKCSARIYLLNRVGIVEPILLCAGWSWKSMV